MEVTMHIVNINEAKTRLSELIRRSLAGDDVVIARANEPLVRMVPVARDMSPRIGGQWRGQVVFSNDFEFSDEEIAEMLGESPSGEAS
jgi:prevent-host-death family protein